MTGCSISQLRQSSGTSSLCIVTRKKINDVLIWIKINKCLSFLKILLVQIKDETELMKVSRNFEVKMLSFINTVMLCSYNTGIVASGNLLVHCIWLSYSLKTTALGYTLPNICMITQGEFFR